MIRAAVAVLAAVSLTGCGSDKGERRSALNAYVESVNALRADAVDEWNSAQTAYVAVGRARLSDSQMRGLTASPKTIRALRAQVAALTPPRDGERLRARLLQLLDLQAKAAAEVATFARYITAVSPLEQRVARETTRLRRTLRREQERRAERLALTGFAAQIDDVRSRLQRLEPPQALAPWHEKQLVRFADLAAGARDAARGLARNDRALVARAVDALVRAAATEVTPADRAAVVAYNARLAKVRNAAAAVRREQLRLAGELS